jgi:hypothetical protein
MQYICYSRLAYIAEVTPIQFMGHTLGQSQFATSSSVQLSLIPLDSDSYQKPCHAKEGYKLSGKQQIKFTQLAI